MKQIKKNPKIFIGFSDLTVLLAAIHRRTKLVAYHGPVVTTLVSIDKQSQKSFFATLTGTASSYVRPTRLKVLKAGRAAGVLRGGNLTTLTHTIGTPYEIAWDNTVLFIEDIGEAPYRLDRLLTHLDKAGRLLKVKGLILGTFSDENRKENKVMQKTVQHRIMELLGESDIPVWADFPVGHGSRNLTLPVGVEVEMDSAAKILSCQY